MMSLASLTPVSLPADGGIVEGYCAPGWAPLVDAFVANFVEREEVGASLCITIAGETLVDIWGGYADPVTARPWQRDTIVVVFSATKGATALCAHHLANTGRLDLDSPVAAYWPEFAAHGKEATTVAMLLDHSAGVPGFREPLKPDAFADWDYMIGRLEREEAFWEPGSRHGYHLLTMGWTVGEIVRRVSGKSLGTYFRENLASPADLDFWIGLPKAKEARVARLLPYSVAGKDAPVTDLHRFAYRNPDHPITRAIIHDGGYNMGRTDPHSGRGTPDTPKAYAAEIGAAGGITNARGLAGLYRHVISGGPGLFGDDTIARMGRCASASRQDAVLQMPTRFGLGFMLSMDNRRRPMGHIESVVLGESAFGHVGMGGSLGFADPDCGLAFGYAMNRMGPGILLDERGQSLVDTAYRLAGYRSSASGAWRR